MDDRPTQDPVGLVPAGSIALRSWMAGHPGLWPPPDTPPERHVWFTHLWPGRVAPGLPGDWRNYLVRTWSYPAPDANTPEWRGMRWTGEYTPRDGVPVPMIISRIHVLYYDSRAWIEGVRNANGGFTITPRGFEHCRSEDEGRQVLRGWKYVLFKTGSGGRGPGLTRQPDFLHRVAKAAHDHFHEFDEHLSAKAIIETVGTSSSRYYAWLNAQLLTSADIKLAASFGSFRESLAYLHSVQQERRHQRI
jgi:hypothetical protein